MKMILLIKNSKHLQSRTTPQQELCFFFMLSAFPPTHPELSLVFIPILPFELKNPSIIIFKIRKD